LLAAVVVVRSGSVLGIEAFVFARVGAVLVVVMLVAAVLRFDW
jgi:hypothetical protein